MTTCVDEFPYTSTLYSEIGDDATTIVFSVIGLILWILTIVNFVEEIWFMTKQYTLEVNRVKVIFILSVFPAVSSCCVVGLLVPRATFMTEIVNAAFLSMTLFVFFRVIIGYFGGREKMLNELSGTVFTYRSPPCCCCCICLDNSKITRKNLNIVTVLCLQASFLRTLSMFIGAVVWVDGKYNLADGITASNPGTYLRVINVISLLLAMWGLLILFRSASNKLVNNRLRAKFLAIQLTIVFSDLQMALLTLLAQRDVISCSGTSGPMVRAYRIHYGLRLIETFGLALLARFAYRFMDPPYQHESEELQVAKSDGNKTSYQIIQDNEGHM